MANKWRKVINFVLQHGYKKLVTPTVSLHGTAFPKTQPDLEKLGVRFDFAGTIERGGKKFHRFQVQVNSGNKIPISWKNWREKHTKGTHAIVTTIEVPDNGTKEEVQEALEAAEDGIADQFKGKWPLPLSLPEYLEQGRSWAPSSGQIVAGYLRI
ncbi:hypothetical protein TEQG_05699 [Trichophyton equinum CBS 127.97]|uniref:Uncharacterized protein n=1 Tax=Trichophyton equinum (strain ATCC MYA-4606 / CBS 127.97) TaxID=559882 RepID=F2PXT7_TRIEC|nr:hypothetical protein TEQG_05699 [Trichophyton equinum CBS 127.97]